MYSVFLTGPLSKLHIDKLTCISFAVQNEMRVENDKIEGSGRMFIAKILLSQ
jgi:hypothetical protein